MSKYVVIDVPGRGRRNMSKTDIFISITERGDGMVDSWMGKTILQYLNDNRYSQTYISKKTGIELPKLNKSLNGKRRLTFREYELICGALGVGVDKFLQPRTPDDAIGKEG